MGNRGIREWAKREMGGGSGEVLFERRYRWGSGVCVCGVGGGGWGRGDRGMGVGKVGGQEEERGREDGALFHISLISPGVRLAAR